MEKKLAIDGVIIANALEIFWISHTDNRNMAKKCKPPKNAKLLIIKINRKPNIITYLR